MERTIGTHARNAGRLAILIGSALLPLGALAQAPNFGPNVYVITPAMSSATVQTTLNSLGNEAQFSTNRYAVLMMPGSYTVQAEVGYYEAVYGLGTTPQSVVINGYLTANQTDSNGNLTDNFWRSVENMQISYSGTYQWGVSQGADFRRMYVPGNMELTNTNCGEASGGFVADSVITGSVNPCSQQQWYMRNSNIGSWSGGVWNMVFSGVNGAPLANYPSGNRYTTLPTSPVSREKPYLYVDSGGNYNVFVPSGQTNSSGATWSSGSTPGYSLPIAQFFIAQPSTPLAAINSALAAGQNLILTPGIYQYPGAITVTNPNTIVLGLGFATLVPQNGTPALTVADVDGVQVAGLIVDAGPVNSPVLVQVGAAATTGTSHATNPTSLNDVFFRIGGATAGSANTSLLINSANVVMDNIWAWRADHGNGVGWTVNTAQHGVVVNADNVTALGLAVEHYQQNQVLWNGNGGETIFYQSELPYDPPSQAAWMNGAANGYASYAVGPNVTTHTAYGLGVYSYFNQGVPIVEDSAITVPNTPAVTIYDAVSVFLAGSGQIARTVNGTGTTVLSGSITSYLPMYEGVTCSATCPVAPANLAATTLGPSLVVLNWTPSSSPGVTYNVYRSSTAVFTPSLSTQVASMVSGSNYIDSAVTPTSTWYYIVQAFNGGGASAYTNTATATTPSNGGVITSDVLDIDAAYTSTAPPTGWVKDVDYTGGSTSSSTHAITIPAGTVNPAPAAVYQTDRNGSTFTYAIPNLTHGGTYIVDLHFAELYFSTAGSRKFNVSINGTPVLTNFDIFAMAGGQYVANVQSFYAVADNTGTITILFKAGSANNPQVNGIEIGVGSITAPGAPSSLNATAASSSAINLSWTASSGTGLTYEVFRSTASGFSPAIGNLVGTTAGTTYTDTGLVASTPCYYVVEASNGQLTSLASNQATATTQAPGVASVPVPNPPANLAAMSASGTQINLTWTASSTPNVQYEVFRSTSSGFTPSAANLVTTIDATAYADTALTGATYFYYVVEATNPTGTSAASNYASASTAGPLVAAPAFAPAPGVYATGQSVALTDSTPGATIFYTTDGTTPTASSAVYAATAIPVTASTVIRVLVAASGYTNSAVVAGSYIIQASASAQGLFIVNAGGTVASISTADGSQRSGATSGGGFGAVVDSGGNVWSIDTGGTSVSQFADTGSFLADYSIAGLAGGSALAIDGNSTLWIAGSGNALTAVLNGSPVATLSDTSLQSPRGVAIDRSGNVWVANAGNNSVTEFIGAGAPIASTAVTVQTATPGVKP